MTTADVYRALWRHKIFILLLTTCFVGAAYVVTKREQPVYESTALIRIQQRIQSPSEAFGALETGQRLAQTYAKIVGTTTIARKIYTDLDGRVPFHEIVGRVSGSPVQDLELLSVAGRSANPRTAQLITSSAPRALRAFIGETGTLRDQVITIQNASYPTSPSAPHVRRTVILALVIALIFNGALALLLEILGDRFADLDEVERLTGKPVLVAIPTLSFTAPPPVTGMLPAEELRALPGEARRHGT
jgi:capsular polysaccharide biosynthesis protein